jgi:dienelactone hydrolase
MSMVQKVELSIDAGDAEVAGVLTLPHGSNAVVVFVHGTQSSRASPRNLFLSEELNRHGIGSLLFDLATLEEHDTPEEADPSKFEGMRSVHRLTRALDWLAGAPRTAGMRFGLFGAGSGAGIALLSAAERPLLVHAVVSRGGEPDLAGDALRRVLAPTLLIVGANDAPALGWNQTAGSLMKAPHELQVITGASHLFTEPGKLEEVSDLAVKWFRTYLRPEQPLEAPPPDPSKPLYERNRPDPRYS